MSAIRLTAKDSFGARGRTQGVANASCAGLRWHEVAGLGKGVATWCGGASAPSFTTRALATSWDVLAQPHSALRPPTCGQRMSRGRVGLVRSTEAGRTHSTCSWYQCNCRCNSYTLFHLYCDRLATRLTGDSDTRRRTRTPAWQRLQRRRRTQTISASSSS